jgi:hypothetical protein
MHRWARYPSSLARAPVQFLSGMRTSARLDACTEAWHLRPEEKQFSLGRKGVARSLAKARAEASKCLLLCANCHAEVEAGVLRLS